MKIKNIEKYIQLYDVEKYLFEIVGRDARRRRYLKSDEFYFLCMWKSPRQKNRYLKNKGVVERVTREAFLEIDETKKIELLCSLEGVGIPTASAILTVVFPDKYAVIDVRCIEILNKRFKQKISGYISKNTWLKYLELMRAWAKENSVTPRELDKAFFALHRESLDKENNRNLYA